MPHHLIQHGARIEGDYSFLEKFQMDMERITEKIIECNKEIKALHTELTKKKTQNKKNP